MAGRLVDEARIREFIRRMPGEFPEDCAGSAPGYVMGALLALKGVGMDERRVKCIFDEMLHGEVDDGASLCGRWS